MLPILLLSLSCAITLAFSWPPYTDNTRLVDARYTEGKNLSAGIHRGSEPMLNCTQLHFPHIPRTIHQRKGAVILYIFGAVYITACICYICPVYFIPSLQRICSEWNLSEQIAGAIVLSIGTSLPELFISIMVTVEIQSFGNSSRRKWPSSLFLDLRLPNHPDTDCGMKETYGFSKMYMYWLGLPISGTFVTEDDTSIGTIIGSSAINLYGILIMCAFMAPQDGVKIAWFPVLYNGIYWILCVLVLIAVAIDKELTWWETLGFSLLYVVYIILMIFDTPITKCVQGSLLSNFVCLQSDEENNTGTDSFAIRTPGTHQNGGYTNEDRGNGKKREVGLGIVASSHTNRKSETNGESEIENLNQPTQSKYGMSDATSECIPDESEEKYRRVQLDEDPDASWCSVFHPPESLAMRTLWLLGLPVIATLHLTVPDCRKPGIRRKLYLVTFIMCSVWCAVFCYIIFWMVSVIGNTLGIPDIVMGLSILALLGGSVPNLVFCFLVIKLGYIEMAVANITGSNTFMILVGLGVVWFTRSLKDADQPIHLASKGLVTTSTVLLASFAISLVMLRCNRWVLNKTIGVLFILLYIGFLAVALVISFLGKPLLPC